MEKRKTILNAIFWGFILWLFGYILGIVFFAFVPKDYLGWSIMPFGIALTLLVLFKKIKRDLLKNYVLVGIIWTIMALVLDYIFLVKLFKANDYYKIDVYIYYILTFVLPVIFGWFKLRRIKSDVKTAETKKEQSNIQ